jgi:hypothetical protein
MMRIDTTLVDSSARRSESEQRKMYLRGNKPRLHGPQDDAIDGVPCGLELGLAPHQAVT